MAGSGEDVPRLAASGSSKNLVCENDDGMSQVLSPVSDLVLQFMITIRGNGRIKVERLVARLHLHTIRRLQKDLASFEREFAAAWGIQVSKMKIRFWDRSEKIFVIQFENREDQESVLKGNPRDINGSPLALVPYRPEMTSFANIRMVHPPWVFPRESTFTLSTTTTTTTPPSLAAASTEPSSRLRPL